MSQEEITGIHSMMDALNAFREDVDSPENLAKIPLLNREDMKREAAPLINEERRKGPWSSYTQLPRACRPYISPLGKLPKSASL